MLELIIKKPLYNEHYPSIFVTFLRETEHFYRYYGRITTSLNNITCLRNDIGSFKWKIPFHSPYENFGNQFKPVFLVEWIVPMHGALRWRILVGKLKYNVQKPTHSRRFLCCKVLS